MKLGIVLPGYLLSLLTTILITFYSIATLAQASQSVAEFDVPYELFAALSDYHDLTQLEEKRHIDAEIIPVISDIITYFEEERQKYLSIRAISAKVKKNLEKMDAHLTDFNNELLFRKKVFEFRMLLEKQHKLKSNK